MSGFMQWCLDSRRRRLTFIYSQAYMHADCSCPRLLGMILEDVEKPNTWPNPLTHVRSTLRSKASEHGTYHATVLPASLHDIGFSSKAEQAGFERFVTEMLGEICGPSHDLTIKDNIAMAKKTWNAASPVKSIERMMRRFQKAKPIQSGG